MLNLLSANLPVQTRAGNAAADTLRVSRGLEAPVSEIIDHILKIPNEYVYVAIALGLMFYMIGWFAGVRANKMKVLVTIIISVTVSALSLSVPAGLYRFLTTSLGFSAVLSFYVVYVIWCLIVVGMATFLYETLIVTAREVLGRGQ